MKPIKHHGRMYAPKQYPDGRLHVRVGIAHGVGTRKGQLMFSVYVHVTATHGKKELVYQVPALRHWQQGGLPLNAQRNYAQFMLDVVALQQECELHLTDSIRPRP